ncbi:MAG TPA: TIR domain-containing protein [Blastocatellia bacterium]|nr:TIR domain-containing protein [Blastocatellia bacterium]
MGKQKRKQPKPAPKPKSSPPPASAEEKEPEVPTFTEIGGSPVPGLTLRHVLRGHTDSIGRIAWSPDGAYLASPSGDKTIRIWDERSGAMAHTLQGHTREVNSVAWSPDSERLASASNDRTIRLWETDSGENLHTLEGHSNEVISVAWSPDGQRLASTSDDNTIRLWDTSSGKQLQTLKGNTELAISVAWSPDGQRLASASEGSSIHLWDASGGKHLQTLKGHTAIAISVAWSPDGQYLATTSEDKTIRLWDATSGKGLQVLEGHPDYISCVAFSADGQWLASKDSSYSISGDDSAENTIRLWRCDTWSCVAILDEPASSGWLRGIAFHPRLPALATLGEKDTIIRIWELDEALLLGQVQESVHYTTAKLVLVGDSGVGKTGLGWRLAHDEFKEHASTHGQQFWPIEQLRLKRKDGTECEAVLWDLAGQHVYRQIHSIFLENVAAALVLFDPSNRQEPLKGVQFWLEQLKSKGQLPPAVLVGARVDRGAPALSQQELEQFCQRYGIRGGYLSTSALNGDGLDSLLETLKAQIPWEEMTATVTTVTFKRIKDYVLALKEKPDRKGVLVSPLALREQLQATDQDWRFTDAEMMTAVGHLETHGYVAVLRSSAGEQHILLTPELLVTLAASIVLLADKNSRELGAVSETELLQGQYPFDELVGLSPAESQILLDAAILRFLEHNICFRETLDTDTLLIFPSLIKQKRPLQDDLPSADDISYIVRGRVENLYASLVVLLGYTPSFTRINQWQHQAQYEMGDDEICGFRLIEDREGEIEVVLYYGDRLPAHGRTKFQELFEQFLYQRDVEVTRFPPVICPQGHRQERATIIKRVREGKRFVHCEECGDKTDMPNFDQPQTIGIGASQWLQREEAAAHLRSTYEVQLTKVKGYRRNWAVPRCYLSHLPEQAAWAKELIHDLRDAGVYVVEQVAQVQPDDFVILLDTPDYQRAFRTPLLATDAPFISTRLNEKRHLISLALTGQAEAHEFKDCQLGSFCDETHYPVCLFDLVLNLYAIPLTHAGFAPLRQALHAQWERTLARKKGHDVTSPLKIFISYSHKDETFKDELVTMLAGLQRRGIVDAWQDRRIEAGDEWNKSIQDAMNDCDLALLLVSPDYLASRFIQEAEQPKLLQRRQEMQLRVIPLIVRPCTWQSEPVLKDLQALPRDNKAVITFSKETGDRDQVWTDIATAIEKRAKAKTTP